MAAAALTESKCEDLAAPEGRLFTKGLQGRTIRRVCKPDGGALEVGGQQADRAMSPNIQPMSLGLTFSLKMNKTFWN